jgi:4-hydroxybenzoate polyprenyltransferase
MRARSVEPFFALARWENGVIAAAGVLFGAWWAGWRWNAGPHTGRVTLAALAAVALTAAANAWNDIADVAIDARAHPRRPLPAGRVTIAAARRLAHGAAATGLALAAGANALLGALSLVVVALMRSYSPWLKQAGLVGNLTVAILGSLPFLYGGWAAGRPVAALPLMAIAAPLHLAREVAKDLDDAEADAGIRRTLPLAIGPRGAALVLAGASIAFLLLLVPYAVARPRLAAAAVPAVALVLHGTRAALAGRRGSPRALKLAMLCTMGAFLVARP